MLSREAASRAPNAATGARASADVAARGEALLAAVSSASRGVLSGRSGAAAARDVSLATALAHLDAAAAALAADGGRRSGAAASARLARAVELLDEHHGGAGGAAAALRGEAARALEEMAAAAGGGSSSSSPSPAAASAGAARGASVAAAPALAAPSSTLAAAADVLASSFSAPDRRVALDALCRAVSPPSPAAASALSGSGEEEARPALMAAWPHLTAEEQVELLDAAEAGTKKKTKNDDGGSGAKSPVPAAAAAAALVAAAVCRGSPSLVARAARLLDAEAEAAGANAPPPSSAARAARVAAALMLGDVAAAEAAVGVSAARQLNNNPFSSVPDPRLVAFVSSHDPRDPLPGLCALAEAWVREAALGGCRPPPSPSPTSSPSDFSLARWASSPAVALRLAAGEQASAARAAAGAARRAASGVGGALVAAAAGARSLAGALASSLRPKAGAGSEGRGFFRGEEGGEGERDDGVGAAYRARFYGSDGEEEEEGEEEEAEEGEESSAAAAAAPPRASPRRRPSSSASSLRQKQQQPLPPLPIEAAKAKTVGELAAAYARATDATAWRSSPLPPDAVRPLEGEDDLWLGTAAARGNSSSPLSALLRGASSSSSLSSLARVVAGGVLLLGAAFSVTRAVTAGSVFPSLGRGAEAPVATTAAAAAAASPLSAKEAKSLLSSFQSAKAQACGPSSPSSSSSEAAAAAAAAASPLEKVLSGKLLAEWKGRQRDLEGWTLSYRTKKLKVVEVVAPPSSSARGGLFSSEGANRAVFLARVEEKVTLRDEDGLVVDESDAGYDARFVAERKGNGEWKLSECFLS